IGAFRECFSSGSICRFCLATKSDLNDKWDKSQFVLRTSSLHARHVLLVESDPSLVSTYGVCGPSCMAEVRSFEATQSLPPDIMHDLHDGVIPFVLKHVIKRLVSEGTLTLKLNQRLEAFEFHDNNKKSRQPPLSRPSIMGNFGIKGSAAEKLCLFRFFSLLVGDVPKDNDAYSVYLALRIVDIVCAPQLTTNTIPYLKVFISDFYSAFIQVFPEVNAIPKMHYLIHYPRLIRLYGPLFKLSSMRFEAKHQYFKSLARKTRNFINICRTLSTRHQLYEMYHLSQPKEQITTSGCKWVPFEELPELLQGRLHELELWSAQVTTVNSVTMSQWTFRKECVLPLAAFDDDLPDFAEVTMIVISNERVFIVATILQTRFFDDHFHAYVVDYTTHVVIEDYYHRSEFHDLLSVYRLN
ncbi:unnamed protein product, partial [Ixodes persulcatus]